MLRNYWKPPGNCCFLTIFQLVNLDNCYESFNLHHKETCMKKTLLCGILLISFAFTGLGQTFLAQQGDSVMVAYSPSLPEVAIKNLLQNTSASDIQIKWRIIDHNLSGSGWTFGGFCDNNICYTSQTLLNGETKTTNTIPAGAIIADFHALINGSTAPSNSYGWLKVEATDEAAHYSKVLTFIASKDITSITTVRKMEDAVSLYPNPARNSVTIVFDPAMGVKSIAIYNLIGKPVSATYKVTGNSAQLNVDNIPSGIYFVRLLDGQGRVLATRKLTRQ